MKGHCPSTAKRSNAADCSRPYCPFACAAGESTLQSARGKTVVAEGIKDSHTYHSWSSRGGFAAYAWSSLNASGGDRDRGCLQRLVAVSSGEEMSPRRFLILVADVLSPL